MDKTIEDLTIKDLIKNCANGCDKCPRKLVNVCKETGYVLCNLANANKNDLLSIIWINIKEEEKND